MATAFGGREKERASSALVQAGQGTFVFFTIYLLQVKLQHVSLLISMLRQGDITLEGFMSFL